MCCTLEKEQGEMRVIVRKSQDLRGDDSKEDGRSTLWSHPVEKSNVNSSRLQKPWCGRRFY